MKNIQLIFFFICFIPSIFYRSEYDDYIITVKSGITEPHCIIDSDGLKKYNFLFMLILLAFLIQLYYLYHLQILTMLLLFVNL